MTTSNVLQGTTLSLLRFVAGLVFLEHGASKLFAFPVPYGHGLTALFLLAGIIEFFGGLLVCIGLFTRVAAFICSGEMATAYFTAHFPKSMFPLINGGDAAILFCFIFFYLVFAGAGPISLDRIIRYRR